MEKNILYTLISRSAALEGASLNLAQTRRLLEDGVSSEGKTIAEQLMIMDLAKAYDKIEKMAQAHEFLSVFKLRTIAAVALRNSGYDGSMGIQEEMGLQKMCSEVNEARLHVRTTSAEDLYKASWLAHFRISAVKPWPVLNDVIARLIMNEVQLDFGLEPTFVADTGEYRKTLDAAVREDIADIFVGHVGGAMSCNYAEALKAAKAAGAGRAAKAVGTGKGARAASAAEPFLKSAGNRNRSSETGEPFLKTNQNRNGSPEFAAPSLNQGQIRDGAAGQGLPGPAKHATWPSKPATAKPTATAPKPAKPTAKPARPVATGVKPAIPRPTTPAPAEGGRGKTRDIILGLLSKHPFFTTADLAATIGISVKGIEKHLSKLKSEGVLKRIGPDKGGHWKVG